MKDKSYSLSDQDDFYSEVERLKFQAGYWVPTELAWLRQLVDPTNLKLLDYGCGQGSATSLYAEHFNTTWGVDHNPSLLGKAKAAFPTIEFSEAAEMFESQLFAFSPDVILLRYVVQHVAVEDFWMLEKLFEVAKLQKKCVVIVDADAGDDKIFPPNTSFESLVSMGNRYTISRGGSRNVSCKIAEIYREFAVNAGQFHFDRCYHKFDAANVQEFSIVCRGLLNVPRKLSFEFDEQEILKFFNSQNGIFLWAMLFCLFDFRDR